MFSNYLIFTNPQKILKFLLLHPDKPCYEREIARGAKISCGSANYVLNQFHKKGLIQRKTEGRMKYYSIDISNPYIKEFKILNNLLLIEPLIGKLKACTHKIILYGSWASGTDTEESDIDLFIVSSDKEKVRAIINKYSYSKEVASKKIQAIINMPVDLLNRNKHKTVFMDQVNRGNVLWEREINEDIL